MKITEIFYNKSDTKSFIMSHLIQLLFFLQNRINGN